TGPLWIHDVADTDCTAVLRASPVLLATAAQHGVHHCRHPTNAIPEVRVEVAHVAQRQATVMKRRRDDQHERALERRRDREEPRSKACGSSLCQLGLTALRAKTTRKPPNIAE